MTGGGKVMIRAMMHLQCISMLLASSSTGAADEAESRKVHATTIDFSRDVYPLLRRSCFECHGESKQEGSLRLDQHESLMDSQSATSGESDNSELIRRIELPESDPERMPAIGKSLSVKEIATLREWIDQGAAWPEMIEQRQHWAYVMPQMPTSPAVLDDSWVKNEIDRFVLHRLEREGLPPSPQASPEALIRRLHLDMIGLPPTTDEAKAFSSDSSELAYAAIVDDLLSRPQFGERWARHWLDLARYADSHGFQRDDLRDNWAYRDWVIRAINDDMPFDQFTIEQLAGDLLPNASESQRIATGFHRCSPTNVEAGSIPEETRSSQVIDRVNTTATVWLGSTLECAQCHDHKFDPFTTKEYYQLLAFFNNTELEADRANPETASSIQFIGPSMPISDPINDSLRDAQQVKLDALLEKKNARRNQLGISLTVWLKTLSKSVASLPQIHGLEINRFESSGSTDTHQALDDGSILLVGTDPPEKDSYVFRTKLKRNDVRGFRIDLLTDPSLPGQGPGRGDAKRPNFVLNEFTATRIAEGTKATPIPFISATADFAQKGFDAGNAIDSDPTTAWAINPQFGTPHWASFVLATPIDAADGAEIEFRMDQNFGGARTIGRFRISAITGDVDGKPIPARVHELARVPMEQWTKKDHELMIDFRSVTDKPIVAIEREITATERAIKQMPAKETLVMIELPKPRTSNVFTRGDYKSPGEVVRPGTPAILHSLSMDDEKVATPNRLTLARWLVAPANPLVARVTVNRFWAELFGTGIVETVEDFGIKGESPSHPELLDYLAFTFQNDGWSLKQIVRQIVMSATYRQSSMTNEERLERDDHNRLLARGPRFRMDAEMIRDNALAISGLLELRQSGPPIRPFQPPGIWTKVGGVAYDYEVSPGGDQFRRGIYVVLKRGAPYPSFLNFDSSNRLTCSVKRSRTNTPLQALTLLNDPVYVTATKAFAMKAALDYESTTAEIITDLFRRCIAREPLDAELESLRTLFESQRLAAVNQQAETCKLFEGFEAFEGFEGHEPHKRIAPEDFSAWYSVASVLLNLHETITKP